MRRREFIMLLGAAAAWPLAARAQRPGRMPLVAVLTGVSDDQTARTRATAFVTRLQDLGWTDGRNMRLEYRWGRGDAETIRRQASDLVALAPDVIVTTGGPATERMLQTTRSVPIVFAVVPDPVGSGFVARLSRPGGNATGFMQFEYSLSGGVFARGWRQPARDGERESGSRIANSLSRLRPGTNCPPSTPAAITSRAAV
jgi:putative tryptophan/tyrosine transport system substrate-binding protein